MPARDKGQKEPASVHKGALHHSGVLSEMPARGEGDSGAQSDRLDAAWARTLFLSRFRLPIDLGTRRGAVSLPIRLRRRHPSENVGCTLRRPPSNRLGESEDLLSFRRRPKIMVTDRVLALTRRRLLSMTD